MPLTESPLGTPGPPGSQEMLLWEIRGMLRMILDEQRRANERIDRLDNRHDEIASRMSHTESKVSWMVGVGAAAVFVIGFLKDAITGVFH